VRQINRKGCLAEGRIRVALVICGILTLASAPASVASQDQEALLRRGLTLLEQGVNALDVALVREAMTDFQKASSMPESGRLARYYGALSAYRIANILIDSDRRVAVAELNSAIDQLEDLTSSHPEWAEPLCLLAGCYGQKIMARPLQAIFLGPKYNSAIEQAEKLDPANPRVVLFRAIGTLNAPRAFGGDREKAIAGLRQAADLFSAQEASTSMEPSWGQEDALAWLGIAYRDAGEIDSARQAFSRALELNPEYGWVKEVLLPALPPR